MDDDTGPRRSSFAIRVPILLVAMLVAAGLAGLATAGNDLDTASASANAQNLSTFFPTHVVVTLVVLLILSAFFSSAETAFLSLGALRIRTLEQETRFTSRLVLRLVRQPGRLLTNILVGNMIVNVLIGVVMGSRLKEVAHALLAWSPGISYLFAAIVCTAALLFFGEITPKVLALRFGELLARTAAVPLLLADRVLGPVRSFLLRFTDALFHVTRFRELRAAPYITDEELKSMISAGEAEGVIEQEERQMIQGILEFREVLLREILVPRPDVIALPQDATVGEALALVREHEFSRIPVYKEDLDHITGVLHAKELLPAFAKGEEDTPIVPLLRTPHFVPETMTVQRFVKEAQRVRSHLAIVVDEYGGTEGIVTLDDALEEVVGDIVRDDTDEPEYQRIAPNVYRLDAGMGLDEVSELLGIPLDDEEHETLAGFLMHLSDKIPEHNDRIRYGKTRFVIEEVEGKRVSVVRAELVQPAAEKETPHVD